MDREITFQTQNMKIDSLSIRSADTLGRGKQVAGDLTRGQAQQCVARN